MNRSGGKETGVGVCLHIKNMVCDRCIMAVDTALKNLGLHPLEVRLGYAVIEEEMNDKVHSMICNALEPLGFELIDDMKSRITERIRAEIISLVHYQDTDLKINLSDWLSERLGRDYSSMSKLFSDATGTTIEKYFIAQKIEKAKELLVYGEMTLNEIADRLGYSSAAYLSTQFKSVTGVTPSYFKKTGENCRKPLDKV